MTLTGPSCAGKTHLLNDLLSQHPDTFAPLVSFTTREPRPGEVHGREYHFVSRKLAEEWIKSPDLVQHVEYRGILYGTMRQELQRAWDEAKVPVRIVEPTGVGQFREACPEAQVFSVYVDAPKEVIVLRWMERYYELAIRGGVTMEELDFFVARFLTTLEVELNWRHKRGYHYYFNAAKADYASQLHALYRAALGGIPVDMLSRLSPMPVD